MGEMPSLSNPSEEPPAKPEKLEALQQQIMALRPQVFRFCQKMLHYQDEALAEDLA